MPQNINVKYFLSINLTFYPLKIIRRDSNPCGDCFKLVLVSSRLILVVRFPWIHSNISKLMHKFKGLHIFIAIELGYMFLSIMNIFIRAFQEYITRSV